MKFFQFLIFSRNWVCANQFRVLTSRVYKTCHLSLQGMSILELVDYVSKYNKSKELAKKENGNSSAMKPSFSDNFVAAAAVAGAPGSGDSKTCPQQMSQKEHFDRVESLGSLSPGPPTAGAALHDRWVSLNLDKNYRN